jgi:hypothetical protein
MGYTVDMRKEIRLSRMSRIFVSMHSGGVLIPVDGLAQLNELLRAALTDEQHNRLLRLNIQQTPAIGKSLKDMCLITRADWEVLTNYMKLALPPDGFRRLLALNLSIQVVK